ncbi:LppU/SCO3897 family protein [Yinghuangia sp. YIM S09857]|uniref:LppU/SCO3897 family protein n=1 Tax=Yinghuangia sp. YIM S09857 TaxID=3436929 RepID=UPI003F52E55F
MWAVAVAAVAAYPVYRFAMPLDEVDAQSEQGGLCLMAFEGSMVGGRLPSSVDCLSPEARWRVTERFDAPAGPAPCRDLPADKGYETGMEWRSSDGEVLCLTVTPFTTFKDYEAIGTMPFNFNHADFEEMKTRLLAATGGQPDPAGEAG